MRNGRGVAARVMRVDAIEQKRIRMIGVMRQTNAPIE